MSHHRGPRRMRAEELSAADVEDSEPTTGLTTGDLMNSLSLSVDPQQSPGRLTSEHPEDPHATAYGSQTAPSREQSPVRVELCSHTATQGLSPSRLAGVDPGRVSPTRGDTEEHFILPTSEVVVLRQEYSEFITLKDNAEIVLAEAMEAMERLNTVFSRARASMNRMSPRMKELLLVPVSQASGKTFEPSNNRAHDRAAAQAATQHIIDQTSMIGSAPIAGADECARTTRSRVTGDRYSRVPCSWNIPEDVPNTARVEQSEAHTVYARDTPEARVSDTSHVRLTRDIHMT
ncbi:hypothetical protein M422DRAFT_254602 [Sphaerobolus stellatus SS14]|uniref:Uncharacterized protein n=1 Tax=Sphaerobolus stellatus (strain SS14) TaxID=990650 RepID=A0A0C9UGL0_SPHS4|nr:hypothetical protein M422DRAFT_254602 [Sphaerobolus stellatus SS14]